ncbi:hypothetical protein PLIIFM63780_006785 [Purpureocillium lilacinum]|uniref:uncharacterized protein n=1 Tax=Purpureocillium lilacinum TaxID=33203 RepID=UPI002089A87B|nr:hypothetical protein PLICBS_006797 [Purpureocillium lilacinum]GJN83237.1 hypothetical protein PLIIFM63780_006785 [Purpureocillium lilacinum]
MAVQIVSDLHLETPKAYDIFEIEPKAPVLALLGDIGNIVLHKEDCLAFLTRQLARFRAVLFVPGNHEAYHSDWPRTLDTLRAFEQQVRSDDAIGEFVLLDRATYRLPGTDVVILGCSLFSFVPRASEMAVGLGINDYFQTYDWDVDAQNEAHVRDFAWLNGQVAELEQTGSKIISLRTGARRDMQTRPTRDTLAARLRAASPRTFPARNALRVTAFGSGRLAIRITIATLL